MCAVDFPHEMSHTLKLSFNKTIYEPPSVKLGAHLRFIFFNKDVLVGFDILACADGAAGPADLDCLNSGVIIYAENSGEFAL